MALRRSSAYYSLCYIVQCQPIGQAFFQPIAAFDTERVAIDYAKECVKKQFELFCTGNTDSRKPFGWKYRVVHHHNNEDKCIYRSDVGAREAAL